VQDKQDQSNTNVCEYSEPTQFNLTFSFLLPGSVIFFIYFFIWLGELQGVCWALCVQVWYVYVMPISTGVRVPFKIKMSLMHERFLMERTEMKWKLTAWKSSNLRETTTPMFVYPEAGIREPVRVYVPTYPHMTVAYTTVSASVVSSVVTMADCHEPHSQHQKN